MPKKPYDPGHAQFKEDGKVIVHASTRPGDIVIKDVEVFVYTEATINIKNKLTEEEHQQYKDHVKELLDK